MQDIILGGYHHSGFLRDLLEAFEQSHEVRPKKPPELFGFLSVTLIFYKASFATWLLFASSQTCFYSRILYPQVGQRYSLIRMRNNLQQNTSILNLLLQDVWKQLLEVSPTQNCVGKALNPNTLLMKKKKCSLQLYFISSFYLYFWLHTFFNMCEYLRFTSFRFR